MERQQVESLPHIDDARSRLLLRCATESFLANGYAGASVEDIAIAAEVSKPTIYRMFADKMGLAMAVLDELAKSLEEETQGAVDMEASPEDCLTAVGEALARWMVHSTIKTPNYGIIRLMMELSSSHPDIATKWREAWRRAVILPLTAYFEVRIASGEIAGVEAFFLASQFAGNAFSPSQAIVSENAFNSDLGLIRSKARQFLHGCTGH